MKYVFIKKHRKIWPIALQCTVLGVSKNGYYGYLKRLDGMVEPVTESKLKGVGPTAKAEVSTALQGLAIQRGKRVHGTKLLVAIRAIYREGRGEYGAPRIYHRLRQQGYRVGKERVRLLMQHHEIQAKTHRRFSPTVRTKPAPCAAENTLNRQFSPLTEIAAPNRVWASDITYIATREGWLYVTAFIDLFSRKVVGWCLSDHLQSSIVLGALDMACGLRQPSVGEATPGLIIHSDRGCQYTSEAFQTRLKARGFVCSMSRKGNCWDNAPTESLWASLKKAVVHKRLFVTLREAKDAVLDWLHFYNQYRMHSTLGYLAPAQFEARFHAQQTRQNP